jgi:hypothetical protein
MGHREDGKSRDVQAFATVSRWIETTMLSPTLAIDFWKIG